MQKYLISTDSVKFTFKTNRFAGLKHLALAVLGSVSAHSALIAGWDFQTTTTGGTAAVAQPNSPRVYHANFGSGTIFLDGSNGSTDWVASNQIGAFAGTGVNAGSGFSTATTGVGALALIGGAGISANGNQMVFRFAMSGYEGLTISLAAQRTSSGFRSQLWEYSNDGLNYLRIGTLSSGSSAGALTESFAGSGVLGFAPISGLDNSADAYVRVTFDGATGSTGNNRIDNIQFNATEMPVLAASIPEPGVPLLGGIAVTLAACGLRCRRV